MICRYLLIIHFGYSVSVSICRYLCRPTNADPQFHFEYRGPVNMKGKSEPMNVWFLSREKEYIVWIPQRATATSSFPSHLLSQRIAVQREWLPLCTSKLHNNTQDRYAGLNIETWKPEEAVVAGWRYILGVTWLRFPTIEILLLSCLRRYQLATTLTTIHGRN
jgi:hypothetical protein